MLYNNRFINTVWSHIIIIYDDIYFYYYEYIVYKYTK